MVKEAYHPNAYLMNYGNVRPGLRARSLLLSYLEKRCASYKSISDSTSLGYRVVVHHMRLLESRGLVRKKGRRVFTWEITGLGQKKLR